MKNLFLCNKTKVLLAVVAVFFIILFTSILSHKPPVKIDTRFRGIKMIYYKQLFPQNLCQRQKQSNRAQAVSCPSQGIVTSPQTGRLGNLIWETASVWAIAKKSGLHPYIPCCMKKQLDQFFHSINIPCLETIGACPAENRNTAVNTWEEWNGSLQQNIVLKPVTFLDELVVPLMDSFRKEFVVKQELIVKSRNILRQISKKCDSCLYVAVHVRRADYFRHIKKYYSSGKPATIDFYRSAMDYFENKFGRITFVVTSDDPKWCSTNFSDRKNVVVVSNSPQQDLAVLASCNHTVIDYGTYGTWGALLAGGETVYYNLTSKSIASRVGKLLPHWHSYTYRKGDSPIFDVNS